VERGGLESRKVVEETRYEEKRKHHMGGVKKRGERREGANGARKDDNERSEEDEREDREGEFGIASSNANLFYS